MGPADEELMVRVAAGDRGAFAELFARHKPQVVDLAHYFVRSREAAEDIAQETFLRLLRAADTYRPAARFTTWLYTIARNLCYDELRQHRRQVSIESLLGRPPTAEDEIPGSDGSVRARTSPGPDAMAQQRELTRLANDAILDLSTEHRQIIGLRLDEGLAYAEIAERLGCSVGTVKSRLHYALQRLREELLRRL